MATSIRSEPLTDSVAGPSLGTAALESASVHAPSPLKNNDPNVHNTDNTHDNDNTHVNDNTHDNDNTHNNPNIDKTDDIVRGGSSLVTPSACHSSDPPGSPDSFSDSSSIIGGNTDELS